MEPEDITISASTAYRFNKLNKKDKLPQFLAFKKQYQNYFPDSRMEDIRKTYQHGICGRNGHKHIVVVERIGNLRVQDISKLFDDEEMVAFFNQRMLRLSQEVLEEKDQVIWIIDLNGKIMQLASKKILELLTKIVKNLQTYFPDILYRLVFVNTPMLFDTIWSKIAPQVASETIDKVLMIGDEMENLYEFAEPSILPEFLGGDIDEESFISGECQLRGKVQKQKEESEEDEQFDLSSLKQALSGLKIEGKSLQSVSQTPMNTEADESK